MGRQPDEATARAHILTARLSEDEMRAVDERRKQDGVSRSTYVRRLVRKDTGLEEKRRGE